MPFFPTLSDSLTQKEHLTKFKNNLNPERLIFPFTLWLVSRTIVSIAILLVAPHLNAPPGGIQTPFGWEGFSAWDSSHYQSIATQGYEILPNHQPGATVAFFPLFPLLIHLLTQLGINTIFAGILINQIAFLGALLMLYGWVEDHNGKNAAKWTTAVVAWCPLSLFCTVVYSEGLFLLLSTAALKAFDRQSFWQSALWGSFATATRITGLALVPAFILTAIKRRYSFNAYIASILTLSGMLAYSLFCWVQFHDPLAFISVQYSLWNKVRGFDGMGWLQMAVEIVAGGQNWQAGRLVDLIHPIIFGIICLIAILLWNFSNKIPPQALDYSFFALFILLWLVVGDPLLNSLSIVGGGYLLWKMRKELSLVAVLYGFCGLGLFVSSGSTASLNRYAYGIIPLSMALGLLLSRHPRWGYCIMSFFGVLLVLMSIRFSQRLWVA